MQHDHSYIQDDHFYDHLYTGMENDGNDLFASWYHYCVEETNDGQYIKKVFHPELNEQIDQISFADKKLKIKSGLSVHWFDNGNKICHGNYQKNRKEGEWSYFYYENDQLYGKGNFKADERNGPWEYWHLNGKIRAKINYRSGVMHGDFEWYDEEGTLNYRGNYENGLPTFDEKLIDGEWTTNYEGRFTDPYLVGCEGISNSERKTCSDDRILEYMYRDIDYPELAREQGVQGLAVFRVVVDEKGRIEKIVAMRGLSNAITRNSIKLLSDLPAMNPATEDKVPVSSTFIVPIRFRLE